MFDFDSFRTYVAKGLKEHLRTPVIRSNQTGELPPYPYLSYTITRLTSENKGTYGIYEDGKERKPIVQGWSITVQADDEIKATELALKARDWFEHDGIPYLDKIDIVVQSVTGITNRDNLLTIEYEHRKGFDVEFWMLNETAPLVEETGVIETVEIDEQNVQPATTVDELNEMLEKRLDGEAI